jgi:hypothetical protein
MKSINLTPLCDKYRLTFYEQPEEKNSNEKGNKIATVDILRENEEYQRVRLPLSKSPIKIEVQTDSRAQGEIKTSPLETNRQ